MANPSLQAINFQLDQAPVIKGINLQLDQAPVIKGINWQLDLTDSATNAIVFRSATSLRSATVFN